MWPAAFPDVPILLYHDVVSGHAADPRHYEITRAAFRAQLDILVDAGYRVVTVDALARLVEQGGARGERVAVITFDDGYRSFLDNALPELQARGLAATVYVSGAHVGGTNAWDAALGFPGKPLMDADSLRLAMRAGAEIGAHGWMHRNLKRCLADEVREEIERPRDELAAMLGAEPTTFAYPYGEHDPGHAEMVRRAGYRAAVSIFSSAASVVADPFSMRRIYIHSGDTPLRFRIKLSAPYQRYKALRGVPQGAAVAPP